VMVRGVEDANPTLVEVRRSLSVATAEPNSATCILRSAIFATRPIAAWETNGLAIQAGSGVDVKLNNALSIRTVSLAH
jgi:hypothetical protein